MAGATLTRTGPEGGGNFEYQWTGEYIQAHLLSDVGKKRTHNEDQCMLCVPEDKALASEYERGMLFAVADGMGGVSGGEFASRLALQTLAEEYYSAGDAPTPLRLKEALRQANLRIYEEAEHNPQYHGMGTTVSAVVVLGDCAYVAQVGDSRVYMTRGNGSIWQITDDHSLVAEQVRNGMISEEEARNHALKNLITRAVGTKDSIEIDLFAVRLQEHDTLVICSDGLSNVVKDDEIAKSLNTNSLQGAARVLVGKALEGGGPDNITVVLLRVTKMPPRARLEEGAVKVTLEKPGLFNKLRRLFSQNHSAH
jgi:serine/threonine protein phosphatase PrpC